MQNNIGVEFTSKLFQNRELILNYLKNLKEVAIFREFNNNKDVTHDTYQFITNYIQLIEKEFKDYEDKIKSSNE